MIPESYIFAERHAAAKPGQVAGSSVLGFVVIGISSALGFVVCSQLLIAAHTGLADWVASALVYAGCILPAYLAHRRFSFRSDAPHGLALPRYAVVQIAAVALATLFSYVAYGAIGLPRPVAAVVVVTLTSAVNYVVLKSWAFRSEPKRAQ